jgi:hypothetical protein
MKHPAKIPKANYRSDPFVDSFTEIERENTEITIGDSTKIDSLFSILNEQPDYIKCLCSLIPKSDFHDVRVSSHYRLDDDDNNREMSFRIYSGEQIKMNGFISELSVRFDTLLPSDMNPNPINAEWIEFLRANPILYTKIFRKQDVDSTIDTEQDPSFDDSDVTHLKSKCYFFGGSYFRGISLSDIQQYLFYVGTEVQASEYIDIISARELLLSKNSAPAQDVTLQSLSTFEDDVSEGKIKLTFPDNSNYKSVLMTKNTVVSDVVQILFTKEG